MPNEKTEDAAREEVLSAVFEAYAGLPVPNPGNLISHRHREDPAGEERIRTELAGKTWQSLTPEFLARRWSSFVYLSPEAYRYYLPALLARALEDTGDSGLAHSVVYKLVPSFWALYYRGEDQDFREKQSAFTPEQYRAVCDFLGFMFQHRPRLRHLAAEALRWGWNAIETPALEAVRAYYQRFYTYTYPVPEDPERARLHQEIVSAFADVPYPGDNRLCGSDLGDEPSEYAMEFRGVNWQSAHPEFLAYHYPALSFLSGEGYRYYLPAFMLADLLEEPVKWSMPRLLVPDYEDPEMFAWEEERWSGFTTEQRNAICSFLALAVEKADDKDFILKPQAETALEYWSGTPYQDLLCRQPAAAEAEIVFEDGEGDRAFYGYDGFRYDMRAAGQAAECRIDFRGPLNERTHRYAETGEAMPVALAFRPGAPIGEYLTVGTPIEVWKGQKIVARGHITGFRADTPGPR